MKKSTIWTIRIIGLIILMIDILAYVWQPFGTPVNWFWIPFGVIGGISMIYPYKKDSTDESEDQEDTNQIKDET